MKKIDKKKARKYTFIVISKLSLVLFMVGIFVFAPLSFTLYQKSSNSLSDKFFGKKAQYQGIITLWSVDTFEGGSQSRSGFLEGVAMSFEKQNKGAYIKVENLTIDEMVANIKGGIYPNMFSFGTGISGYLKDRMVTLPKEIETNIYPSFYSSGLYKGEFKALAWAAGGYTLISTDEKIENAGQTPLELSSLAFSLSYDKTYKNKTKHINSLTFGKSEHTNALDIFSRSFLGKSVYDLAASGIIDKQYISQTPFEAYSSFVSGRSSMLLGTQRDIFRMENRLNSGLENNVIYQPLGNYTDLVSYISILNSEESIINVCSDFVKYLISSQIQEKLASIGMLSPSPISIYTKGPLFEMEKVINASTIVKSAF